MRTTGPDGEKLTTASSPQGPTGGKKDSAERLNRVLYGVISVMSLLQNEMSEEYQQLWAS
jgi:hypothetical protein